MRKELLKSILSLLALVLDSPTRDIDRLVMCSTEKLRWTTLPDPWAPGVNELMLSSSMLSLGSGCPRIIVVMQIFVWFVTFGESISRSLVCRWLYELLFQNKLAYVTAGMIIFRIWVCGEGLSWRLVLCIHVFQVWKCLEEVWRQVYSITDYRNSNPISYSKSPLEGVQTVLRLTHIKLIVISARSRDSKSVFRMLFEPSKAALESEIQPTKVQISLHWEWCVNNNKPSRRHYLRYDF
jgi:hypothetical protein